jgi:hypothetical protein
MWLLSNGREQHEPDSHRRERNPEGSTERNPEGRERDVSLPRSLVGSGEFGAVRMSGRRHDLGIGATGLSDSPRLGDEQERHWPHAGERPRDGETTSSRATASGVRTRRPGDAVRAGLLPRSRSRCGRRGVPGERPGRSTGANVVVPGSCAHCRWRGRTERRPLVEKRLGLRQWYAQRECGRSLLRERHQARRFSASCRGSSRHRASSATEPSDISTPATCMVAGAWIRASRARHGGRWSLWRWARRGRSSALSRLPIPFRGMDDVGDVRDERELQRRRLLAAR